MTLELVTPEWTRNRYDQIEACRDQLDKCCCELLALLSDGNQEHSCDLTAGFCAITRVIDALLEGIGS